MKHKVRRLNIPVTFLMPCHSRSPFTNEYEKEKKIKVQKKSLEFDD